LRSPRRVVLTIVATAALVAGGSTAVALAQSTNPLSPGFPQPSVSVQTTTATPTVTATSTSGSGSFGGSSVIVIAVGALIVLGGISIFIWRDARRRAPARHRVAAAAAGEGGRSGSKRPVKQRKLSPAERKRRKRGRAR
jgi:hypothetical protein